MRIQNSILFKFGMTLICLVIVGLNTVSSQGTDYRFGTQHRYYLGLSINPSHTLISDGSSNTIKNIKSSYKSSISAFFETGYYINRFIGLSTGIGFNSYASISSLTNYQQSYDTTDLENESYNRRIYGENIKEIQKISFLQIPLLINLNIPVNKSLSFFLHTGVGFSMPLNSRYSSSGTFSYSGYYQSYNVLFSDIPFEGFQSDVKSDVEGELKIRPLIFDFIASAGMNFSTQKKAQFSFGLLFINSLTEFSDYEYTSSFRLSSSPNKVKSLIEGSNRVKARSIGFRIGLRYFIL
jgi:hypothetical protein